MSGASEILVVDDHEIVLEVLCQVVEKVCGLQTAAFDDPRMALEAFAAEPMRYALMMTDFKMPHMDGAALAQAVRRVRPGFPVICVSAFMKPADQRDLFDEVLPKPFEFDDLRAAIKRQLERSAPLKSATKGQRPSLRP